jgi:hypothetical protein
LSLEEQLAIRPAVNVKIPNNFTVDFSWLLNKIFIYFLIQRWDKLFRCYLNVNVWLLKAISILI